MTTSNMKFGENRDPAEGFAPIPKPGRKPRFAIGDVVAAALEITAETGLDSVTMRSVSVRLETSPMTLYRYVEDHEALLRLVADASMVGIELGSAPDNTVESVSSWLEQGMRALRSALLRYPGTAEYLMLTGPTGPHSFSLMAKVCRALTSLGLTSSEVAVAYDWLVTTGATYIAKEQRLEDIGGGEKAVVEFQQRAAEAVLIDGDLGPVLASFSGDMEDIYRRSTSAVIKVITDRHE